VSLTSVELAHVYRAELADKGVPRWQERLQADRLMVAESDIALVFVDDYPEAYTQAEKDRVAEVLYGHALQVSIPLDAICFESSCAAVADELAANLDTYEGFKMEANPAGEYVREPWGEDIHEAYEVKGDWLEKKGDGHYRATLLRKEGYWMCPALSAIWTLARLGVEPYMDAVLSEAMRYTDRFEADTVTSVLPVTYIDNEAAVVEILRQLRKPRIPLSRVRYVLT